MSNKSTDNRLNGRETNETAEKVGHYKSNLLDSRGLEVIYYVGQLILTCIFDAFIYTAKQVG